MLKLSVGLSGRGAVKNPGHHGKKRYLISQGVSPSHILALTFSDKAAPAKSETMKPCASTYMQTTANEQSRDVSGMEWRSTGRREERTKWSGDEHAGTSTP